MAEDDWDRQMEIHAANEAAQRARTSRVRMIIVAAIAIALVVLGLLQSADDCGAEIKTLGSLFTSVCKR